jgi:hypothetical protein
MASICTHVSRSLPGSSLGAASRSPPGLLLAGTRRRLRQALITRRGPAARAPPGTGRKRCEVGGGKEGGRGIGCLAGKAVVHGVNWSSPHGHTRFAWGQPQRCSNGRRATRCSRLLAGWRPARGRAHLQKQCTMQSEQGSSARLYLARSCGEGRGKAVGMRVRLGAPSRFLSVQGSTRARSGQSASRAHAGLPAPRVSRGTWRSGPRCEHWTARASTHLPARGAGEAADKGLAAEVNQAVPDAALQRRRGAHHQ